MDYYIYIVLLVVSLATYVISIFSQKYVDESSEDNKYIEKYNNNYQRYNFLTNLIQIMSYSTVILILYYIIFNIISEYSTTIKITTYITSVILMSTIILLTQKYLFEKSTKKINNIFLRTTLFISNSLTPIEIITKRIGYSDKKEFDIESEKELYKAIDEAESNSIIENSEKMMIKGVLELDDTLVREIRVPRPDIESINARTNINEIYESVKNKPHTRYPIINEDNKSVVGYLDVKDILSMSQDLRTDIKAKDIARDIIVVPETTTISKLLQKFQNENKQIATIINEWGTPEGIVTIEDIIEIIVGDIKDEFDKRKDEPEIRIIDESNYITNGSTSIKEFDKMADTSISEVTNKDTIAGLILEELGYIPQVDDMISTENMEISIKDIENKRIETVHIKIL